MRKLVLTTVFVAALPAYANNPPAPQMLLGDIFMLPVMVLFTAIGGGYAILRRLRGDKRSGLTGMVLGAIVAIIWAMTSEGAGMLVLLLFAVLALIRAVRLVVWGVRATRPQRAAHLEGASSARLLIAGLLLSILAIAMAGLGPAFVMYWPRRNEEAARALRKYVALQAALREPAGAALVAKREEYERELLQKMDNYRNDSRAIVERVDADRYTIYLLPSPRRMPFFPYNYLISEPTYRADQSGFIRKAEVHYRNERCPPDAPVADRIHRADIDAVLRGEVLPN